MIGIKRAKKTAHAPYLLKKFLARFKSLDFINLPNVLCLGISSPNLFPKKKFSESPAIQAIKNNTTNNGALRWYIGFTAIALAANNRESPGKNGKITAPVSIKIIAKRIR